MRGRRRLALHRYRRRCPAPARPVATARCLVLAGLRSQSNFACIGRPALLPLALACPLAARAMPVLCDSHVTKRVPLSGDLSASSASHAEGACLSRISRWALQSRSMAQTSCSQIASMSSAKGPFGCRIRDRGPSARPSVADAPLQCIEGQRSATFGHGN